MIEADMAASSTDSEISAGGDITPIPYIRTNADIDLEAAVREAIDSIDGMRGSWAEINVSARDGHVTLTGYVQSPMRVVEAEREVAYVPGVVSVTSRIFDDGTLSRQVAEALALDPRTRGIPPGYQVTVVFGHVVLIGFFTNDQARAAMAVAQTVPGVRSINVKNLT